MINDSKPQSFVNKLMPFVQLARLDKPWGIVLLAWPTLAALALSATSLYQSP